MNYEDMSDFEVNKAVAFKIRGRDAVCVIDTSLNRLVRIFNGNPKREEDSCWVDFDPCNNPSDAWPIIYSAGICINFRKGKSSLVGLYGDCPDECEYGGEFRAAMICFLKMKDAEK